MRCRIVALLAFSACVGAPASAQLVDDIPGGRAGACCFAGAAQRLAEQLQDWNQLGRYHQANIELTRRAAKEPGRVVFMGDSITDGWPLETAFPCKPYERHRAQQRSADARDDPAELHGHDGAGQGASHPKRPCAAHVPIDPMPRAGIIGLILVV